MAVSRLLPSGGANDFNLNITGLTTVAAFDKEYAGGSYSIVSSGNDATVDIYAYNNAGTLVGYTATKAFTASGGFNKMVILGGTVGDVLGFTYKKTITTTTATAEVTAGPAIYSLTPTAMPNVDATTTITGANFASNVTVTFSSTVGTYTSTAAKSIVRSSSTSLLVTRPDNLPIANSPYTITVSNPGVANPIGSNSHILSNAITAGVAPVWVTGTTLPTVAKNIAYSQTVQATDADGGSSVSYSVVTSSLPTGLSFNTSSATISGTPSVSNVGGGITIRATDSGGNFVDRAFTMANTGPTWVTAAGALTASIVGTAYSNQLSATDDGTNSYSVISGALPGGLSLSSAGLISGTPTTWSNGTPSSFTIRVTDDAGNTADRAFTLYAGQVTTTTITSSQTWTAPLTASSLTHLVVVGGGAGGSGGAGCGGSGGGGAAQYTNVAITPGANYTITIGGGGASGGWYAYGGAGGSTTAFGYTQNGGQPGGPANGGTNNNGGASGNGFSGGGGNGQLNSGAGVGGGGGSSAGNGSSYNGGNGGNAGAVFTASLNSVTYGGGSGGGSYQNGSAGSGGGVGGAGYSTGTNNNTVTNGENGRGGAGGAQGMPNSGGPFATGGSGVVVLRYLG